jgi:hypothetical protein
LDEIKIKMKLVNKINNKTLLIVLLVAVLCIGLVVLNKRNERVYYPGNGETQRDPGSAPSSEEQKQLDQYYKECPFIKAFTDSGGSPTEIGIKVTSMKCSADQDSTIAKGEEVKVEIQTTDFEAGKKLFRDWLKSKGLSESPTLRITYIHKPNN